MEKEALWRWTFNIWPITGTAPDPVDQVLMAMMETRHEIICGEQGFLEARVQVIKLGLVLHDIERWAIVEPEFVAILPEEYEAAYGHKPSGDDLDAYDGSRYTHDEYHPSQF